MSSNVEDSDGSVRVTRNALKRIASNESLNSVGIRADTPTLQLRIKKLESISENAPPQQNKGNSLVDSPRRTRKGSVEPASVASPLRRTTRAMSQEKDIAASPLPLRSTRRSALADSDTDDVSTASLTPNRVKNIRKKRQSAIPSPTIENIAEEPEEAEDTEKDVQEKDASKFDKSLDQTALNLSNELELRTRSISKSPQVNASPKKSLNGSKAEIETRDDSVPEINFLEFSQVEEEVKPSKFFKNRAPKESANEKEEKALIDESMSECSNEAPAIEPFSNVRRLAQAEKTTFDGVLGRISNGKPKPGTPPSEEQRFVGFVDEPDVISEKKKGSASNTPVRARRSIHDGKSPRTPKGSKIPVEVEEMMEDFVSDENEVPTPKGEKRLMFKKTPKPSVNGNKTMMCDDAMEISQTVETLDMEISLMDSSKTVTDKESASNEPSSAKKNQTLFSYIEEVTKSSSRSARKSSEALSNVKAETSPEKQKLSRSWSQSIAKSSEKSVDKLSKSPRPEIVKTADQRVKGYSSDELEEDEQDEKNSYVDDEAEVGSTESITESELNYLKENEIPEEGESIGSEDSIEDDNGETSVDEDEEEEEDDSFIAKDEDISNEYSMDSNEERIEESFKKSPSNQKRKSRLIFQSESEDEPEDTTPSLVSESDIRHAPTSKSPRKSLNAQPKETVPTPKAKTPRKSIVSPTSEEEDGEADVKSKTPRKSSSFSAIQTAQEETVVKPKSSRTSVVPSSDQEDEENEIKLKTPRKSSSLGAVQNDGEELKSNRKSLNKSQAEEPVSSKKLRKSLEAKAAEENLERPEKPKLKRKREAEDPNVSVVVKTKRVKLGEDDANESEAKHMENVSGIAGLFNEGSSGSEPEIQERPKKKDTEAVINKCNELMGIHNEGKKKALALKREKKLLKQLKKQQEAAKAGGENLDSSGSNKENGIKKKKKNKSKERKQKLVADVPDETREDISTAVSKLQEKMERKRLRKLAKKLAKQQEHEAEGAKENKAEEAVVKDAVPKTRKKAKMPRDDEESAIVMETPEVPKTKKTKKAPVAEEPTVEDEPTVEEVSKKKKKSKENREEPKEISHEKKQKKVKGIAYAEPAAEVSEKKKSKKRKLEEVLANDEAPKPKKLNVLKQIEDPWQNQPQARSVIAAKEPDYTIPLGSNKLKKVIPANVEIKKKNSKKSKKQRRVIAEPETSLPRPVFTTSGIFIEQPATPAYKFTSTKYVPIRASASASTKFGVVAFEANQKKTKRAATESQPEDFRSRYLAENTKGRDGSKKNIRGLISSTKSF